MARIDRNALLKKSLLACGLTFLMILSACDLAGSGSGKKTGDTVPDDEEWGAGSGAGWVALDFFGEPDEEEPSVEYVWNDVHFVNDHTGWVVGGFDSAITSLYSVPVSVILKTTDGGETWVRQPVDIQARLHAVFFLDSLRGWTVGSYQGARTVDGGETWIPMGTDWDGDFEGQAGRSVFFLDALQGWIGGEGDGAYGARTEDGGVTWTSVESQIGTFIQFVDSEVGWRHTYHARLHKTTDGGATWTEQHMLETDDEFMRSPKNAFFLDASVGWMVGRSGALQQTEDGGETWTSRESGTSAVLTSIVFADASKGMVVGRGVTLKTTDGGVNWTVVDTVADLGRLSLLPSGRAYALGFDRLYRW